MTKLLLPILLLLMLINRSFSQEDLGEIEVIGISPLPGIEIDRNRVPNSNQTIKNKSLEKKSLKVLVENQMKNKTKLFGRTEYMTSVIFEGSKENIGKIVEVEIDSSNQHTLFGILKLNDNKRVA